MRYAFLTIMLLTFAAVSPTTKIKKAVIKTNATCEMCKVTIEKALYALDGVESAELDLITKKVKVRYNEDKLNEATLRQAISAAGYLADDVPPRPKARETLPDCCKSDEECKKPMEG
ncbi:MAG: heavy metal-associated domain-containing protein [Bacteroidota bacterium]